ncbi:ABC transporter ATP-binding protein [Butyrivibrio fibrisolvens]|uniref:ABC transporter ATP-binding protein n=1 Tax=Butyrivibrio fibrisolvens TaxID=831 RepID=UPI0004857353|nr:ABC transporter ATP-binding protein [Butyrivibrio fibrisolvens]
MIKNVARCLKRIIRIMTGRQKFLGGILVFLVLACAGLQILSVYIIAPLVSAMTDREEFLNTPIVALLTKIFMIQDYRIAFLAFCICVSIVYFFKEVFTLFQTWFSIKFSQKMQREISNEVFRSYMYRDYDFFLNYGTPKIVRDVNEDPNSVYLMLLGFINLFTEIITMFLLLIYVIISDFEMAICMACLAAISLIILVFGLKRRLQRKGEESRVGLAYKHKVLLEAVEGIKEVQVMKKQESFIYTFYNAIVKAQDPLVFQSMAVTAPTSIIEGVFVIGIVLFMGVKAVIDNSFWNRLPILASFMMAAIRMLPSMGRITNNANNIQFYIPAFNSVYNNIKIIREQERDDNNKNEDNGKNLIFEKALELDNVSYHYSDSTKDVLSDLDLRIKKGQSIGIIGHSGSGKSTLADLILGLHIPQKGSITIDGTDISKIQYEYSRVIGYVPQNVYLVDGTIRENVAFGVPRDEINENDVISALKKANLYDLVNRTDKGLDTIVGEKGIKFSGGQRQRIAIARALYRKPQILILDEATSALDNETEATVMEQVEEMQGTITLIIIAHRLSTLKKCDVVYEVVGGKVKKVENHKKEG